MIMNVKCQQAVYSMQLLGLIKKKKISLQLYGL